jgi:hypothetical protein
MLTLRRPVVTTCAALACVALAALTARAELEERMLAGARALLDLPGEWLHGPPRTLSVNGARILVSSGRSELALSALLDHVQAGCRATSGGLAARAPGAVLRAENEREGVVACFALGAAPLSSATLVRRLERFAEQLDLAELGGVMLVRAEARPQGSFLVMAESQGPAPLQAMFPRRGDAVGADPDDPPRPQATRRLLSVHQADHAPALFVYESGRASDALWADYLAQLARRGWSLADPSAAHAAPRQAALLLRGGRSAVVVVEPAASGARLILLTSGPGS